jgi:CubicO group peptidase (beta-lactamase class C family)
MRRATGALKAMSTAAFLSIATIVALTGAHAYSDADIRAAVERQIQPLLDGTGGAAVAVYSDGRTLFYNFGEAREGRPVTSDALFNLASIGKVFVSHPAGAGGQAGRGRAR